MKLTFVISLVAVLQTWAAVSYSQTTTLSINLKNATVQTALQQVEDQSEFYFLYSRSVINVDRTVDLQLKNAKITEVLNALFNGSDVAYKVDGRQIVLSKKSEGSVFEMQQQKSVSGKVTDTSGGSLPGVSVVVKGTTTGSITDSNGNYSLSNVPTNATLQFSFVGMRTQEIAVSGKTTVNVILTEETVGIDEVIAVGYTTQSRHKTISAVSTASGDELTKRAATDPQTLLQGKLPGLQVVQNSGEPGNEGTTMRIRGVSTFSGAGNDPLIIVDGIPGSLTALNPNDIESVSLLKDAASAAIYGSRGANGVVVITTKSGKSGKFSLSYDYSLGVSNPTSLPDIVSNSAEFMALSNEAYTNSGRAPLYTQAQIDLYAKATDRVKYPNHNWLNDIFQTAIIQNHYLNMSGGFDKTNYKVAIGITDQPGTMTGFEFKKYTLDINLSSKVNKRVTIGTNVQMRYSNKITPENGAQDQFLSALAQSPLYPAQYDGKWIKRAYSNEQGNKNPVAIVGEDIRIRANDYYLQGSLFANVDIIKGLTWENKLGTNFETSDFNDFRPVIQTYFYNDMSSAGLLDDGTPGLNVGRNSNLYTIVYSQLNFKRLFGDHNFSVIGGVSQEDNKYSYQNASRLQFDSNLLKELNAGPTSGMTNSGTSNKWAISSLYGNFNYDYKDKYLLGASVRYDGTSRLPKDTRWGLFYSFSGAWRISKENFFKNIKWVDDMKIRGSWGELGNQNIGNYPYQSTLNSSVYAFSGNVSSGYTANTLVDPFLSWETTRVVDFGLDFKVLSNRLSVSADWFNKYTFDILRGSQVPLWLGLNAPTINDGAVRNKGLELNLQYSDKINGDLSYSIGGSLQTYKNILEKYGKTEIGGNTIRQEGQPLDEFYMYVWDGIFQSQAEIDASAKQPVSPTPGDLKIKDVNGDKLIDDKDRVIVGGRNPSYQFSINLDLKWKNFDLSAMVYSSQGSKIYVSGWGIEPFRQGSVPTTDWRNRWTPTNHTNTMPKIYLADGYPAVQNYPSTYFLKDGSYIRLKNVQIGYTLPANILDKMKIQSVRFYCTADNLFTASKFPGLDPERTNSSGNYVSYPQNRTFTFGATIHF